MESKFWIGGLEDTVKIWDPFNFAFSGRRSRSRTIVIVPLSIALLLEVNVYKTDTFAATNSYSGRTVLATRIGAWWGCFVVTFEFVSLSWSERFGAWCLNTGPCSGTSGFTFSNTMFLLVLPI